MEPASLVVGVVALKDTVVQVVEYLHDVREGGKQRLRLSAELSALWIVLENVQVQLKSSTTSHQSLKPLQQLAAIDRPHGVLAQCNDVVEIVRKKLQPRSGMKGVLQNLKWPFDKDEVDRYLETIHRLQDTITLAYAQTALALLEDISQTTAETKARLDEAELRSLLNWLSSVDFETQQQQIYDSACPGTGQYLFRHSSFKAWTEGRNRWLWVSGTSGTGKTVLSSIAVRYLSQNQGTVDTAVIGRFLQDSISGNAVFTCRDVIGSLLKQLILTTNIMTPALQKYREQHARSGTKGDARDLQSHLFDVLATLKRVYVVFDGIDKLPAGSERNKLMQMILDLPEHVSLFIAASRDPMLEKLMPPLHHICDICSSGYETTLYHCGNHAGGGYDICAKCYDSGSTHCPNKKHEPLQFLKNGLGVNVEPPNVEIELYVKWRLESHDTQLADIAIGKSLRAQIIRNIADRAQQKFLYAKIYLDHLCTLPSLRAVKSALEHFPKDIDETYRQALDGLQQHDSELKDAARQTLKWVMCARTALALPALESAVTLTRSGSLDEDDVISGHRVVAACGGLIVIHMGDRVTVVHETAKKFLDPYIDENFPEADFEIAATCLNYLMMHAEAPHYARKAGPYPVLNVARSFYDYAVRHWAIHMGPEPSEALFNQALVFLTSEPHVQAAANVLGLHAAEAGDKIAEGSTGLRLASHFGLNTLVPALLRSESSSAIIDARDRIGRTPLMRAVTSGHLDVAKILITAGATINTSDTIGLSPLNLAIDEKHDNIIQYMLSLEQCNVNFKPSVSEGLKPNAAPAINAASKGQFERAQELLKNPNLQINEFVHGSTALVLSASTGNMSALRQLLKHPKIDVNDTSSGKTALVAALKAQQYECVRELLQHPACQVDLPDDKGHTPLQQTVLNKDTGAGPGILALIEFGANINHVDADGNTALHLAVSKDRIDLVNVLSKSGADMHIRNAAGQNIMHLAATAPGQTGELFTILDTSKASSPSLTSASRKGDTKSTNQITQLLNTQDNRGETPLHIAVLHNQLDAVKEMISHGADLEIENNTNLTPYQLAIFHGHQEIVREFEKNSGLSSDGNDSIRQGFTGKSAAAIIASNADSGSGEDEVQRIIDNASLLSLDSTATTLT